MKTRGLLIAAIALAVLAGAMYWSNKQESAKAAKASTDSPDHPKVVGVAEDQVQRIEIRRKGMDPMVVQKEGTTWKITQPLALPGDSDQITTLASTLSTLTWDRLVEEKDADLSQFGLNTPEVEVVVGTKDGKSRKLVLGDPTPTNTGYFAKMDGDARVFTVSTGTKSTFEKTPQDLRDKRLLTFDSNKLTRVEVTANKDPKYAFGKNAHGEWQIVEPKPIRADNFAVEDLIRKVKESRMEGEDELKKANLTWERLDKAAELKFVTPSGTQTLELRRNPKEKAYFMKTSAVDGAYKIHDDLGDAMTAGVESYRNGKVFDFGYNEPGKVEVRDGGKTYTFQKSGEKWTKNGAQADSTKVQMLIDKIRELKATEFYDQGWDKPGIEITVNWLDGKRQDKVAFLKTEKVLYAKRDGEPTIYAFEPKAIDEILKSAAELK